MRYRIKQSDIAINYQSTNTIEVRGLLLNIDDIRLIVDETQKIVLCSSMQKDLVQNIDHDPTLIKTRITFATSLITLASGDKITFEVDLGEAPASGGGIEMMTEDEIQPAKEDALSHIVWHDDNDNE